MAYTGKATSGTNWRTNDGSHVPKATRDTPDEGDLTRDSKYRNDTKFNEGTMGSRALNGKIRGMQSQNNENLDDPGFDASGSQIFKKGTPYGEGAYFNQLPPGHDISDQLYADIHEMPMKMVTDMSYPGDGAFPPKDVPE